MAGLRDWVPSDSSDVDREINRIREIHASKDIKNYYKQEELAKRRELSKMTSQLMVRENQNINILRRVGPSNVRPGRNIGAAFFHRDNLLAMPLRRQNVLNIPYSLTPIKQGPINAKLFQRQNMVGAIPSDRRMINVINDPFKVKTTETTFPYNTRPSVKLFQNR